jgi:hypothetical protein
VTPTKLWTFAIAAAWFAAYLARFLSTLVHIL